MKNGGEDGDSGGWADGRMPNTRWTLIDKLHSADDAHRDEANEELCRIYRQPVLAFIRSRGLKPEDAEDLTQELFARFSANDAFSSANPEKGRLRSYIYTSARRLVAEYWRSRSAEKRGGGQQPISLDGEDPPEPSDGDNPEREFDRLWAQAVLAEAGQRLRKHFAQGQQVELGAALEPYLSGDTGLPSYAQLGQSQGLSESAAKVAVFRVRKRMQMYIEEALTETLKNSSQVATEMDALKAALRDGRRA